ncbi:hypothetical protein BC936DRAFT_148921 [Jimgerdemannia flammicorona]|uniref:Uncharacterized protein n=1 Tax=Jimgerdemannia flammicorona TaxID=994334 RepID=A0A433D206_9FUNG|nr:hypothetical protein BC936DRAFT_148921 [Jimgerdemannia flammicorona]
MSKQPGRRAVPGRQQGAPPARGGVGTDRVDQREPEQQEPIFSRERIDIALTIEVFQVHGDADQLNEIQSCDDLVMAIVTNIDYTLTSANEFNHWGIRLLVTQIDLIIFPGPCE